MARGLNKVQIIGNLGRDVEMKYTPSNGKAVASFSVAVTSGFGDRQTTEWFRVVAWEKLAETCNEYLRKGSKVYIEGRLQTRKYPGKDGAEKETVELVANEMIMLDGPGENGGKAGAGPVREVRGFVAPGGEMITEDGDPDDLPF